MVYSFEGKPDGAYPVAGLIDVNGTFYGTTEEGGGSSACNGGCGTVFEVFALGGSQVIYSFNGGTDGVAPVAGLLDVNGTLYGTTESGGGSGCGGSGCGTVFAVTASGSEGIIYRFKGGTDGQAPVAALTAVNGTLYGTTELGGASDAGTVFQVTTSGKEHLLYSFKGTTDGWGPRAGLIDANGTLYGTTEGGGAKGFGTVFGISP